MVTVPVRPGSLMSVLPAAILKNFSTLSISTSRKSMRIFRCGACAGVPFALLSWPVPLLGDSLPPLGACAMRVPVRWPGVRFDGAAGLVEAGVLLFDGSDAGVFCAPLGAF